MNRQVQSLTTEPSVRTGKELSIPADSPPRLFVRARPRQCEGGTGFNPRGGCFSPDSLVERWETNVFAPVRADDVKAGDLLRTVSGMATVRCVTFTPCPEGKAEMVRVDALVVTPYHPIRSVHNEWIFPVDVGERTMVELPHVVNFVLDTDHELIVDAIVCVTLGHGKTDSAVVMHEYWGSDVVKDLQNSDGWADGRVRLDPLAPLQKSRRDDDDIPVVV